MHNIKIKYNNIEYSISEKEGNLLDIIREAGIPIGAPCGGKGTCKKCRVFVKKVDQEIPVEVLACQIDVMDDLSIEVPPPVEAKILSEAYWPDLDIIWNKIYDEPSYGLAIDIGTTTVVVYLDDLNTHKNISAISFLNPQSSYGADVISRIQSVMQNPKSLTEQKELIINKIGKSIQELSEEVKIPLAKIKKVSVSGNNPMLHFFKGTDPSGLAIFPFKPSFIDEQVISGRDVGLEIIGKAEISLLPSLSAYVGADIIAGIASTELPDSNGYSLYLDIGTNGEMALGNKDRILTCATAAGPAFEGAKISCGLGGVEGAIHTFNEEGYETIGSKPPIGLCGSGLVDVIAYLLKTGKLDPSGYAEKAISIINSDEKNDGKSLELTPLDIREVQLAKGAIAAGIKTLIMEAGIQESNIERLYLAGGFGHAISVESASRIGLIPGGLSDKVIRAGNLAGLGARLALHSEEFKKRVNRIRDKAEYFELSNHMGFNEAFVMEMGF